MGLFIGRDTYGKKVLSISKLPLDKEVIADATNPANLVFHSKIPYITIDTFTYTNVTSYISSGSVYGFKVTLPSALLDEGSETRIYYVYINGATSPLTISYGITHNNLRYYQTPLASYYYIPDGDTLYITAVGSNMLSQVKILVMPITTSGAYVGQDTYDKDIFISKDQLSIGGVDFFKKQWLVSPAINTIDQIYNIMGKSYQLINSVPSTENLMLSVTSEHTYISIGGKIILDSNAQYVNIASDQLPMTGQTVKNTFIYPFTSYLGTDGLSNPITVFTTIPVTGNIRLIVFSSLYVPSVPNWSGQASLPILYDPAQLVDWFDFSLHIGPGRGGVGSSCFTHQVKISNGTLQMRVAVQNGIFPETDSLYMGPYNSSYLSKIVV